MLNLYLLIPAAIVLVPFVVVFRGVIAYLQDPKGLRKYPTQNCVFTKLGYCWELGRKHPIIHSRRLYLDHTTKGHKVIRLGPNWISFGHARAARDIYGFTSSAKKSAIYDQLSGGGGDKSLHKFRRSMVAHYYAPKHQRHWEESWVLDSCADFMKAIDTRCTKPMGPYKQPDPEDLKLDLVHWGYTYACEVMIKIGMSKDLHLLDKGNNNIEIEDSDGTKREVSIVQSLHCAGRAAANVIWDTKHFTMCVKLMRKVSKEYAYNLKGGGDWHAATTKLVLERMDRHKKGEKLDDLFMPWMEGKDGNEPDISTPDRIADPRTFQKLREELDAGLPPHRSVATWQQVKSMPYLKACIDEAMRLYPPVATDLIRRTPPEGMVVDSVPVPGNTDISISAYTSHRDPTVFPAPEKWYPDRWIKNRGTEMMKDMLASWIPFSAGYRTCMGRNVSIACVIGTLVHNYDFALPSKDWELRFEEWFNLWPTQCPVKVWKREKFAQPQPAA
ncbi:hypothetical protein EYZ11_003583 [Aspergillus tanneri]|uniref:Cytochrome P450 n=1 Tax=Aspergillus tanneri TaxID=1220188 RepID=A0A4S3JMW8_9EURO|nr:hypothetical protein EYZ11_003583 [Aspergillus tanneri]